jgi:RNA polymerase-associated protein RTF1
MQSNLCACILTSLQAEWDRYKRVCLAEGVTVPEKMAMVNKIDDINRLVRRKWTDEELSEKTKRQAALYSRFSGVERDTLTAQLERARARGDEELVNKLQDKLDHLEVPRLAFKTSLNTPKKSDKKGMTQQEKLAIINAENRKRNTESVRKAQLKERAHIREIQRRIQRGEDVEDDSSRRVVTRMKFVHDVNEYDDLRKKGADPATPSGAKTTAGSGASTPANGTSTPKTDALMPHIAKLQELQRSHSKSGIPTIHKPLMDDDIIGALDLDIDIDID